MPPWVAVGAEIQGSLMVPDSTLPPAPRYVTDSRVNPASAGWSASATPSESVTDALRVPLDSLSPSMPRKYRCSVCERVSPAAPLVTRTREYPRHWLQLRYLVGDRAPSGVQYCGKHRLVLLSGLGSAERVHSLPE